MPRQSPLLRQAWALLDRVERCNLAGGVPGDELRVELLAVAHAAGFRARPRVAGGWAGHDWVLRLIAHIETPAGRHANRPVPHPHRRGRPLLREPRWPDLKLPVYDVDVHGVGPGGRAAWYDLCLLTVERARDRWEYLTMVAARLARAGEVDVAPIWARAERVWANYWRLHCAVEAMAPNWRTTDHDRDDVRAA